MLTRQQKQLIMLAVEEDASSGDGSRRQENWEHYHGQRDKHGDRMDLTNQYREDMFHALVALREEWGWDGPLNKIADEDIDETPEITLQLTEGEARLVAHAINKSVINVCRDLELSPWDAVFEPDRKLFERIQALIRKLPKN